MDKFYLWLVHQKDVHRPKSTMGKAIRYRLKNWQALTRFVRDVRIPPDNNRSESALRVVVLGRRNWLFTWLDLGGERTAATLTIVATCIAHDLNPRAYLHLVTRLIVHGWPQKKLRELLPDRILGTHPELYVGDRSLLLASDAPPFLAPA